MSTAYLAHQFPRYGTLKKFGIFRKLKDIFGYVNDTNVNNAEVSVFLTQNESGLFDLFSLSDPAL